MKLTQEQMAQLQVEIDKQKSTGGNPPINNRS